MSPPKISSSQLNATILASCRTTDLALLRMSLIESDVIEVKGAKGMGRRRRKRQVGRKGEGESDEEDEDDEEDDWEDEGENAMDMEV